VTRIDSYIAGELFLTQTLSYPRQAAIGHLWDNSGTKFVGPISAAPSKIQPIYQDVQDYPALELMPLAPRTSLLPTRVHTFTYRGST
jgi:hypothetical protein